MAKPYVVIVFRNRREHAVRSKEYEFGDPFKAIERYDDMVEKEHVTKVQIGYRDQKKLRILHTFTAPLGSSEYPHRPFGAEIFEKARAGADRPAAVQMKLTAEDKRKR